MLGGLTGGILAAAAGYLAGRPWPWPLRLVGALLVLGGGFFGLWMFAGGQWVVEQARRSVGGQ
jgi:hypothetical protein